MRRFLPRSIILQVFICLIVFVVFLEFLMFSYLGKRKVTDVDMKYVKDYEKVLCRLELSFIDLEYSGETKKPNAACPNEGIVTAFKHWSLSKNMWIYANMIAFSVATTLRAYAPFCLKEMLGKVFANLTISPLSKVGHCVIPLSESVGSLELWDDTSQSIVITESDLYTTTTMQYLDIACQEFTFKDGLKSLARNFLDRAAGKLGDVQNIAYIGVYITKTNIILNQEYDDLYPSVQFFLSAMNYFRSNYDNTIFVVICDRAEIWETIFKARDVFILSENSLTEVGAVLSILSHCNHTILSSGDTAIWAAILAGGETVISISLSEDYNNVINHFEQWTYLTNDSKSDNIDEISYN